MLLMLIFLRQRIRIAIALLKEASRSGPACDGEGALGRGGGLDGVVRTLEEARQNCSVSNTAEFQPLRASVSLSGLFCCYLGGGRR